MADAPTQAPIGNRLALIGAVLYLLEWVAIIGASPPGPLGPGTGTTAVVAAYSHNAGAAAVSAGWFAVCLTGRVLYMAGLKASLPARPRELPLMDVAVAAMAISVALEVAAYAVVAGAARLAAAGADSGRTHRESGDVAAASAAGFRPSVRNREVSDVPPDLAFAQTARAEGGPGQRTEVLTCLRTPPPPRPTASAPRSAPP